MLLEIKKYPDPVLRKKTQEIKEVSEETRFLAENLAETMQKKDGLGLAAPQVGVSQRIIAVQGEKGVLIFLNPRIVSKSRKKEIMEEGCLSFPGVFLKIKRPKEVEVAAQNIQGQEVSVKAAGLLARVLQHEIDHLAGKLIIDRLSFFQKLKAKL